jgi:RNA polymerase sigma-70 factor (ECF subfamily)
VDQTEPVAELVRRWQDGDVVAAEKLFSRYARQLARLAEQHLSRKVAGRVDGEDVVQSVFRTFFRRSAEGAFRIDNSAQLWQLLVQITVRKARAEARHHTAAVRDVGAEAPAELPAVVAHEPTPEEAAILVDQVEALVRGLPALTCHVLDLRLQGCSVAEIAVRHGVSRQTVYRLLQLLQHRLARQDAATPP